MKAVLLFMGETTISALHRVPFLRLSPLLLPKALEPDTSLNGTVVESHPDHSIRENRKRVILLSPESACFLLGNPTAGERPKLQFCESYVSRQGRCTWRLRGRPCNDRRQLSPGGLT